MKVNEKPEIKGRVRKHPQALNMAVLLMDSMSRAGAMHFLPKTKALLERLQRCEGKHCAFIFNRAQITGAGTANNLSPLLCGRHYKGTFADMVAQGWTYSECQSFIWNTLEDVGYVSAYGQIANIIAGQREWNKASIDNDHTGHVSPQYLTFDTAANFIECGGCDDGTVPCCGVKKQGEYQFEYMKDFHSDEVYPKAGKFSFAFLLDGHSNEAHQQSEDDEILAYLSSLLEREDTVVHFGSDHGNGNEGWRLPLTVLLVPNKWLEQNPEAQKNLFTNQQRLTNHFDMYETYKHFATWPEPPMNAEWENKPEGAMSLLSAEISQDRECGQIGTPPQFCSCLSYTTWNENQVQSREEELKGIVNGALTKQNAVMDAVSADGVRTTCMKLEVGNIIKAKSAHSVLSMQGAQTGEEGQAVETIQLKYKVQGNDYAVFKILFDIVRADDGCEDSGADFCAKAGSNTVHMHVMSTTYKPFIDCRDNRVNPHFCICKVGSKGIAGLFSKTTNSKNLR